jgi:hypothetical protein
LIKSNVTKLDYLKMAIMFLPIIFYNPFFLTEVLYRPLRIGYLLLLSIYLFFSSTRYSKNDALVFGAFLILSIIMVLGNSSGTLGLISIGNYLLTIFFGWGLYRYLASSERRSEILIELYVKFFFLAAICSILSILYLPIFGELDLFGIKSNVFIHLVTPFGVVLKKDFYIIEVYRSYFYFVEPVYAGTFYAANIVLVAPYLKDKIRFFIVANLVGGFLTYSFTFYIVLLALYAVKKLKSLFTLIAILIFLLLIIYFIQVNDIMQYSSFDDRLERYDLFFMAMDSANSMQSLFGHGVIAVTGDDKAFSSGLATSIFEFGYIGTVLQMIIIFALRPSFIIFILFTLTSTVIDPIKMPLFWFFIIATSHKLRGSMINLKIERRK